MANIKQTVKLGVFTLAIMNVTAVGKILTVLLPTLGMMMFPIFTVYVTQIYTRNRKSDS